MTTVHPAYDVATRTWFINDAEAPTLRELLGKLPCGTRVANYHPMGRVVSAAERGYVINDLRASSDARLRSCFVAMKEIRTRRAPMARGRAGNGGSRARYDHDEILRQWLAGESSGEIGRALGIKQLAVSAIIQVRRQRGDQRAVRVDDPRRASSEQI